MAPAPIVTQEVGPGSIQPFDLSCYTHVLQENFSLAKSAIQYGETQDKEYRENICTWLVIIKKDSFVLVH